MVEGWDPLILAGERGGKSVSEVSANTCTLGIQTCTCTCTCVYTYMYMNMNVSCN